MSVQENPEPKRANKSKTGDFRFCEAMVHGRIVRNGPERKTSNVGENRVEATILVAMWDPKQHAERENPVYVRVKAFAKNSPIAFQQLEACERLDRVSVAGNLLWHCWEDKNGGIRQELQLMADHVLREDRFPGLKSLLEAEEPPADTGGESQPEGEEPKQAPPADSSDVPF